MSMLSGLLRYISLELFSVYKPVKFTAAKNNARIRVAIAAGCRRVTARFVAIISALKNFIDLKENVPQK